MNRALLVVLAACAGALACSPAPADGSDAGPVGGPVSGPADSHCVVNGQPVVQPTEMAACHPAPGADAGTPDAVDGGDPGAPGGVEFGATMFNAEGDDDDCKYHVKWSATAVRENSDIAFTVTATKLTDGTSLAGAAPYVEAFLDASHPAPTDPDATEVSPGTYRIAPMRFDAPGKWTVRFHFYGDCSDESAESPHAHAAFFLQVP